MPYLFVIFLFIASSVNAGVYAGAGLVQKLITGTYYEEDTVTKTGDTWGYKQSQEGSATKNSFDISQPILGGEMIVGYGFEDGLSAQGDVILWTEGYEVGASLQYGFDLGFNTFYPHILVGGSYTDLSGGSISVYSKGSSSSTADPVNTFSGPEMVSLKIGVGASFIVTDNIVIYGDIMMFFQDVEDSTHERIVYDTYDGSGIITKVSGYDPVMFAVGVGVKFYMSGATSKRYNLAVEAENQRQQEIDDYIN